MGVQAALDGASALGELGAVIVGGLLVIFSMWWIYFAMPTEHTAEQIRQGHDQGRAVIHAFAWGYGHLPLLASAAAAGAGLSVAIDHATDHSELSATGAALSVTLPLAVYVLSVWAIHFPHLPHQPTTRYVAPAAALAIVAISFGPLPILTAGILMALLTAALVVDSAKADRSAAPVVP